MYSHIRFVKACKVHGIDRYTDLPYYSRLNPFMSYFGIAGTMLISITKGFAAFIHVFDYKSFITNYSESRHPCSLLRPAAGMLPSLSNLSKESFLRMDVHVMLMVIPRSRIPSGHYHLYPLLGVQIPLLADTLGRSRYGHRYAPIHGRRRRRGRRGYETEE